MGSINGIMTAKLTTNTAGRTADSLIKSPDAKVFVSQKYDNYVINMRKMAIVCFRCDTMSDRQCCS